MRVSPSVRTAAVTVVAALALVACGSSSNNSTSSGAAPSTTSAGGSGGSTGTASPSAGSSGSSTNGTIQIGFASPNSGPASLPAIAQGAQAAAAYLNATQGGLDGRKIDLVTCDMQSDAQAAQECGQKFANDQAMPFAIMGLSFFGGPYYTAMSAAHKASLGGLGVTPADSAPADAYFYYPGATFNVILSNYLKSLKPTSVSILYDTDEAAVTGYHEILTQLSGSGIKVTGTQVPASAADFTPQVEASKADTASLLYLDLSASCGTVANDLHSLGITPKLVVAESGCLSQPEVAKAPSNYQGWQVLSPFQLGAIGSGVSPDVTQFLQGWSKYGPGGTPGTFAELGWGLVLTAAKVFHGAPTITTASAAAALRSYKGPVVMGPTSVSCPGPAPYTATCGNGLIYYKIGAGGKYTPFTPAAG